MEPAMSTSREADSRASRAIFTPREFRRCTSSARPSGASLKRFAPNVLVSIICAPASMYAWCTRKTASGSVALSSSKQRCVPTASCNIEPIAPSAMSIESFSRSLKSRIFKSVSPYFSGCRRADKNSTLLFHEAGDGAHQIVFGENFEFGAVHFHEDGGIFVAENVSDPLDGRRAGNARERLTHDFAHNEFAQVFALERHGEDLIFVDRADGKIFFEDGNLRNVL